ncbi:putative FtsX-related transmembrane transport protein [Fulvivirga imtechensis AK7]|uniref:Putative FtsX-related transmembrane transport protein n=1 Tax=Fulvivirga imtechensis AK7 TaxID=1237149 RepID=L8JS99_9BACT|nr:ABC transporter permease [Fulvivirga imtechensis]ELR70359.1 putative FtsX-related transmembrane transport protein [Fulvivirga imtechensis AK7]
MLKNYLKIAIRNVARNKVYSFINIAGLTLGITCCSLLFLFVLDETAYDAMHSKKDDIYRIVEINDKGGEVRYFGQTSPPTGPILANDYEEVVRCARLFKFGGHINFSIGDTKFGERAYYFADSTFFEVFDFELITGDRKTALDEPFSMVIDEDWSQRLFGNENPIGKEIVLDDGGAYVVTAVMKNVPQNSHLQLKILTSLPYTDERFGGYMSNWNNFGAYTYVVLDGQAQADRFAMNIPAFIEKYFEPEANRNFYLQSLNDIHFKSKDIEFGAEAAKGQEAYIFIFMGIGIFMLLIASINYVNLATAKSLHRGKEIGMRKVSGAQQYQLVLQFLSESAIIALISMLLSIGLVDVLLPYFNQLTDKQFVFNSTTFGGVLGLLFIITLAIGLLSGIYPALVMSRLKPARILKGAMSTGKGSVALRKILVVTQFTLSIIMIIATIVASNQMDYIQERSLGFNKEQLIVVDINSGEVRRRFEVMKNEFAKSPYITGVAVSSRVPGEWKNLAQVYLKASGAEQQDSLRSNYIGFDEHMLGVYEMELLAGENFSGNAVTDSLHVLINETAAQTLGFKEPVGRYIQIGGGQYQVIGVVKDFNFESLHNRIAPLVLGYRANAFQQIDYFSLKFDPRYTEEAVAHASKVHDTFDQNTPIEYHFLDEQWEQFYKSDQRAGNIFTIGAGITIFVACLGLFGLASFIIQKRTKEIGVRKVLGASIVDLFLLLSKTFALQVLLAFLIATPVSWYLMNDWLNNFAFRFNLGVAEFLLAGVVAFVIALVSVSYRVIKATLLDPVNTLRNE